MGWFEVGARPRKSESRQSLQAFKIIIIIIIYADLKDFTLNILTSSPGLHSDVFGPKTIAIQHSDVQLIVEAQYRVTGYGRSCQLVKSS